MEASRRSKKPNKFQQTALCCTCKLSVSSSSSSSSSSCSSSLEKSTGYDRYPAAISSLAHAMVQERLDQMIKQRQKEARHRDRRRSRSDGTKFIIMVAMEKTSYDPREDFKESMIEIIITNRLREPGELRNLLNYYISMNSQDYHGLILEIFHEVCINLFLR